MAGVAVATDLFLIRQQDSLTNRKFVNPGQVAKYKNGIRKQKVKSFRKLKTGGTKHGNVCYTLRQTAIKKIKLIRLCQ
jgi:hypothetical protein